MTDEQFDRLMDLVRGFFSQQYTITNAADWPILVFILSILFVVVSFVWIDLRNIVKNNREEWRGESERLWTEIRDLQKKTNQGRKNENDD